ncbi:MAG: VOC family protein [Pseudomonadota bacterium]
MSKPIAYNGGLTLSLSVTDMDRAVDWYQTVLGFELLYRMDDIGWCELATGVDKVNVGLSVTEEAQAGGATPTFGVADIKVARATLEQHGVRLDGDIMTIPDMVHLQTFYDPDDNSLMFFEEVPSDS